MKKWLSLIVCLFTLPAFAKNSILIIGDSISAGYGINITYGWVNLLKNRLNENGYDYDVINASISGNTTSQGLAQLPSVLAKFKPNVTIIELGGNDGLRGLSITVIKKNLQSMITLSKKAKSQVLLLGLRLPSNYGTVYTAQFQAMCSELGKENEINVVNLLLKNIDDERDMMQPDNIHPTMKAQKIMLDNVWEPLKPLLQK